MMSSKVRGCILVRKERMPALSSWNTPSVSPWEIISYTAGSSMGMSWGVRLTPRFFSRSRVSRMTVRVRRPRKSILSRPSFSMLPIGYWVVMTPSLVCRGT